LDDWGGGIPFNALTLIDGPVASGKTVLLTQFIKGFAGPGTKDAHIIYMGEAAGRAVRGARGGPLQISTLSKSYPRDLQQVGKQLNELAPTEKDLVLIDDARSYPLPNGQVWDKTTSGQVWAKIARWLQARRCTTILASTTRRQSLGVPAGPPADSSLSSGMDHLCTLKINLAFIVTTNVGPVIEVTATKNRFSEIPDPLRLWIRPGHKFPISKT
jgi:hypothetical protein